MTGLPITGPFQLAQAVTPPASVPALGTLDVPGRFVAQAEGPNGGRHDGTLTVVPTPPASPGR